MSRILLADDDRAFGLALKQELEQRNFSVDLVQDGVEAVLRCMDKPYACIVIDGQMPRLNGIDALRIIKKVKPRGAGHHHLRRSWRAGEITEFARCTGTKCLAKPFEVARLEEEIRNYFNLKIWTSLLLSNPPFADAFFGDLRLEDKRSQTAYLGNLYSTQGHARLLCFHARNTYFVSR